MAGRGRGVRRRQYDQELNVGIHLHDLDKLGSAPGSLRFAARALGRAQENAGRSGRDDATSHVSGMVKSWSLRCATLVAT